MRHTTRWTALGLTALLAACADGPTSAADTGPTSTPDATPAQALSCEIVAGGCDEVLPSTGYLSVRDRHIPGRTLCIAAGTYSQLYLDHVTGDEGNPVVITNCDGPVIFDSTGTSVGIEGQYTQYVHVTGTGDPSVRYGIEQRNANLHGVSFDYGATDIEIDHLEVHHNGYLGIGVQAYPRCDGLHHRGNFEQRNTLVHDNYVHHATTGEGMYIGSSHYELDVPSGYILDCPETGYLEPPLINVRVYDNLVEDVGRDGIQVGAAIHGMEIAHNVVRRYAILHDYGQVGGLQINPGSVGLIHHNRIESFEGDVDGTAIQYAGGNTEDTEIYDNVIVGSPTPFLTLGYMIDDTHQTSFHHNTIVDRLVALPNGMHNHPLALDLYCNAMLPTATPHRVSMLDNIFVGYDWIGPFVYNDGTDDWFKIFDSHASLCPIDGVVYESAREPDVTVQGNFFSHDVADAQFVDAAAGDYHVSSGSPAAGMGARD